MNVRMNFGFLDPGMQPVEEFDLCAALAAIAGEFEKCFRTYPKPEIAPTRCRCAPPPVWI
jgi:hypothetical protein